MIALHNKNIKIKLHYEARYATNEMIHQCSQLARKMSENKLYFNRKKHFQGLQTEVSVLFSRISFWSKDSVHGSVSGSNSLENIELA